MIYAVRCGIEFVKFGKANNPRTRLFGLQTGSPYELKLIAWSDWPDREEFFIHDFLQAYEVRGEWFRSCNETNRVISFLRDERGLEEWLKFRGRGFNARVNSEPEFINSRLAHHLKIVNGPKTSNY